jgi:hypothetical protein
MFGNNITFKANDKIGKQSNLFKLYYLKCKKKKTTKISIVMNERLTYGNWKLKILVVLEYNKVTERWL